ncbi:MAG: hypothetical protein JO153_13515 [Solirubrobacterales bacterium]|nr:hypothetical protein [Solirubrobacterales bacterium]
MLQNRSELEQMLRGPGSLGAVFARHAYGMRRWVELFAVRLPQIADAQLTELVASIVCLNAKHTVLFRERALAHGVNPDAYVCPPEGQLIYERMAPLDAQQTLAYALGSLEHFADLLAVYAEVARDQRDAEVLAAVRADNDRSIARLREVVGHPAGPSAAAHELYRLRELAETPLYANGH